MLHFVVAYEQAKPTPDWGKIEERIRTILAPYSWVRALKNVYVVPIKGTEDFSKITEQLIALGASYRENIYILISPPADGGTYGGSLPPTLWPELNTRTRGF
jgi:hypothetical protein